MFFANFSVVCPFKLRGMTYFLKSNLRDFLVGPVAIGLSAPSARGLVSVPGQGTRSYMPQLRSDTVKLINKNIF